MSERKIIQISVGIVDYILLLSSLALVIRARFPAFMFFPMWESHINIFLIHFMIWIFIFMLFDLYNVDVPVRFSRFFFCLIVCMMISSIIFYLFPNTVITPKTNLVLIATLFSILYYIWRRVFDFIFVKLLHGHEIMLTISDDISLALLERLQDTPRLKYKVLGVLVTNEYKESVSKYFDPDCIYTDVGRFQKAIVSLKHVKTVVSTAWWFTYLYSSIYQLMPRAISIVNLINFHEKVFGQIPIHAVTQYWLMNNIDIVSHRAYIWGKRIMDIAGALLLIPLLFPVMILVCITIKFFGGKGPVFFKQIRIGQNNKPFTLYKFRTMQLDAEKDGAQFATKQDPRVTKLGKILRKTYLDEIPQIFNVLIGTMSFIGPRPEQPDFVKELTTSVPHYQLRHIIKPGISGLAQIRYGYTGTVEDTAQKVSYDLFYVKNMGFVLDFQILLRTLVVVIIGKGSNY